MLQLCFKLMLTDPNSHVSQALKSEVRIPGTDMRLSYLSSRTPGYKSLLRVTLTHTIIPFNLMKVHLMVAVEGRLFRKWFPAAPNLVYDFLWDKTDVYSQKVYGLSETFGKPESQLRMACLFHVSFSTLLTVSILSLDQVCVFAFK